MDDDIGNKTIGDTSTRIDFPYKCKYCGNLVRIEDRFRWKHDCIPESKGFWSDLFSRRSSSEIQRRPIVETYAKGYRHRTVNSNSIFRKFVDWIKNLVK